MIRNIALGLIILSAVGFISALLSVFLGSEIGGVSAEQLSRICSNLALIAIAIAVWTGNINIGSDKSKGTAPEE
ncbi:hypothetical protein HQ531_14215 [bacterium]|nr:hypothetical protein [bacterium]